MAVSNPITRKKTQMARHRTGKNSAVPRIKNARPTTERNEEPPYRIEEKEVSKMNVLVATSINVK